MRVGCDGIEFSLSLSYVRIVRGKDRNTISLRRYAYLLISLGVVCMASEGMTQSKHRGTTVTVGRLGDRWLDTMQFAKVSRAKRNNRFGYEVTYALDGGHSFTLFWSRAQIDLAGTSPGYRMRHRPFGTGRLIFPDRITSVSLPDVYRAIQSIERDYHRDADGAIAAAEAFGTITMLSGVVKITGTRLPPPRSSTPGSVRAPRARSTPGRFRPTSGSVTPSPKLLPKLTESTRARLERGANAGLRRGATAAGRALQKHATREGSWLRHMGHGGNHTRNAAAARRIIDRILNQGTVTTATHRRFGEVIKIRLANGAGAWWKANGDFIGFLERFTPR